MIELAGEPTSRHRKLEQASGMAAAPVVDLRPDSTAVTIRRREYEAPLIIATTMRDESIAAPFRRGQARH